MKAVESLMNNMHAIKCHWTILPTCNLKTNPFPDCWNMAMSKVTLLFVYQSFLLLSLPSSAYPFKVFFVSTHHFNLHISHPCSCDTPLKCLSVKSLLITCQLHESLLTAWYNSYSQLLQRYIKGLHYCLLCKYTEKSYFNTPNSVMLYITILLSNMSSFSRLINSIISGQIRHFFFFWSDFT